MANADTLELVRQEDGLIKSTPTEETLKKIAKMRVESVKASNNSRISRMTASALVYIVKYLRNKHYLSDDQIKNLSSEDLNRMPGIIIADRWKRTLLLGWIPLFGWVFAGKYFLFKSRVKFLKSLDENAFDKANIEQAIRRSYPSDSY
ncbi:MAG: hypothetical protein AAB784_03305 [Patescibacteria group bacterium]